jgi:hypothetical protein
VDTHNPSIWEAEAGGLRVWEQPELYSETLSQKVNKEMKASTTANQVLFAVCMWLPLWKARVMESVLYQKFSNCPYPWVDIFESLSKCSKDLLPYGICYCLLPADKLTVSTRVKYMTTFVFSSPAGGCAFSVYKTFLNIPVFITLTLECLFRPHHEHIAII